MSKALEGKSAVVTGAGGGIGREVALALACEGAKVVVNDLGGTREGSGSSAAPAQRVVEDIEALGGTAVANYDSVSDFNAAQNIIATCVERFGRIDILVNIAGILRDRMMFNMTEAEWDAVINVHLKGTFNTCRHAVVEMKKQRYGRIVNFTSDAWRGTVGHVNYGAAKGGIVSLSRSIALELGRYGLTCNVVAPLAATRMTMDDEVKAGLKKRLENGILTHQQYDEIVNMPGPQFVPPIVLYLASDNAASINGEVFHAEGGRIAIYSQPVETKAIYKDGIWTFDELAKLVPASLANGLFNPAPPMEK